MKPYPFKSVLLIVTGALSLLMLPMAHAGRVQTNDSPPGGRLIVWRSPGLGNDVIVRVIIDGRMAADITYGGHFQTNLAPGRHVVGVQAFPQPFPRDPWTIALDVKPGLLYNFTAKGGTAQLVLKQS